MRRTKDARRRCEDAETGGVSDAQEGGLALVHPGHRLLDDHTLHGILEAAVEERIRADKDERSTASSAGAAVEEVEEPPGVATRRSTLPAHWRRSRRWSPPHARARATPSASRVRGRSKMQSSVGASTTARGFSALRFAGGGTAAAGRRGANELRHERQHERRDLFVLAAPRR